MKVKSIAPWFGGKRSMARDVIKELGPHIQYFEPFCGSMAVLLAKDKTRHETANDLHGELINLARVLQHEDSAERLYCKLQATLVHEDLLSEAREYFEMAAEPSPIIPCDMMRAYWYFLASWMGRNGVAGLDRTEFQIAVRWTAGGGSPTIRWQSATDSIPAWHERLKNVVILNRDAFDIIPRFEDTAHTAIYVDPPYPKESRSHGSYLYDFEEGSLFGDDHQRLAEMLGQFKQARVVVSSYDCPRTRELYDGWTFVDHSRQKNLHTQNRRGSNGSKEAPEVLIINGKSFA